MFANKDINGMLSWFHANIPNFWELDSFRKFISRNPDMPEEMVLSEYGTEKWIEMHCPDSNQVALQTFEELKDETRKRIKVILAQQD